MVKSAVNGVRKHVFPAIYKNKTTLCLLLLLSFAIWSVLHPYRFMALWLTQDQQGKLLFELGDYKKAAQTFATPIYKGVSFQLAGDYETAAVEFGRVSDPLSVFAQANALSHAKKYQQAKQLYQTLLSNDPDNKDIAHNLKLVTALLGQHKAGKAGTSGEFKKDGTATTPSGSKQKKQRGKDRKEHDQFTAYAVLRDPRLNELWMKSVRKDPSTFLKKKFKNQYQHRAELNSVELDYGKRNSIDGK